MNNKFMTADDVAEELGISKSHAYKIIRELNTELKKMGKLTIAERVNRNYFLKKLCFSDEKGGENNARI